MRFRAKVIRDGMPVTSKELEAGTAEEAERLLGVDGFHVLSLKPLGREWDTLLTARRFNLMVFNQQLQSLLAAGQPIVDAIEILEKHDQQGSSQAVYRSLTVSLRQGKQLSEAMAALPSVFPALYIAMLRASETTGSVNVAVKRFMQYQRQVNEIRSKLLAASVYPAILVGIGFIVVSFLLLYVVPRFSQVFDEAIHGADSGGMVQWWGNWVHAHQLLAWSGVLSLPIVATACVVSPLVRRSAYALLRRLPTAGERLHVFQLARFYRTLGLLLRSGVSVPMALRMTEASLPIALQPALQRALKQVEQGQSLAMVFTECGLTTEVATRLLVAGESSGDLKGMMERIADFYDQEVAGWIDIIGRLIEPVLMVTIGMVIGGIVLLLYAPIFDLANSIQ